MWQVAIVLICITIEESAEIYFFITLGVVTDIFIRIKSYMIV